MYHEGDMMPLPGDMLNLTYAQLKNTLAHVHTQDVPVGKVIILEGKRRGKWWGSREKQPVIAIHGWQDNAGSFDTLVPLLSADIAVLCIDLPGHGFSSHYPPGQFYYIFWDGLTVVRRIVKHFKWKNIVVMGHSLGGAIGFLYAATFPEDIDKLISLDIVSPAVRDIPKIVNVTGQAIDKYLKYEHLSQDSVPCYDYDNMIDLVDDAYHGSLTRKSSEILMKRGMRPSTVGYGYHFSRDVRLKVPGLGFLSLDMVLEYASKIICNVLNIRGKPGMVFDRPENYHIVLDKIRETARNVEFFEVEGTHHLHLNNPERIAEYINNFLDRNVG